MSTTATYDNDDSCDSDSDGEKQPTAARLVQGSLILVMCVVNLGGNTLLWVTIIRFRRFHRGMYVFLLSMAASDSFLGAVNMPMLAYGMLVGRRTYGCTVCQVVGVTYPVCVCATITSVCAVSVNRYVRVCKQHWYPKVYQGCYTMFFHIAGTWIIPLMAGISLVLNRKEISYVSGLYSCSWALNMDLHEVGLIAVYLLAVAFLVVFCNISIYRTCFSGKKVLLQQHTVRGKLYAQQQSSERGATTFDSPAPSRVEGVETPPGWVKRRPPTPRVSSAVEEICQDAYVQILRGLVVEDAVDQGSNINSQTNDGAGAVPVSNSNPPSSESVVDPGSDMLSLRCAVVPMSNLDSAILEGVVPTSVWSSSSQLCALDARSSPVDESWCLDTDGPLSPGDDNTTPTMSTEVDRHPPASGNNTFPLDFLSLPPSSPLVQQNSRNIHSSPQKQQQQQQQPGGTGTAGINNSTGVDGLDFQTTNTASSVGSFRSAKSFFVGLRRLKHTYMEPTDMQRRYSLSSRPKGDDIHITMTVFMVMGLFFFGYFPGMTLLILEQVMSVQLPPTLKTVAEMLTYFISSSNPIIYGWGNLNIRNGYKRQFAELCGQPG